MRLGAPAADARWRRRPRRKGRSRSKRSTSVIIELGLWRDHGGSSITCCAHDVLSKDRVVWQRRLELLRRWQGDTMRVKKLQENDETTFALIFDKGDEVMDKLTAFAREQRLTAAHFTAIGTLSDAMLGYFDRTRKNYTKIHIDEQVEVLSLVGDVALDGREPKIHAHIVLGKADGTAHGGHLIGAH